jgi:hypothetical protein
MLVVVWLDDYLTLATTRSIARRIQWILNLLNDQIPTLTTRWDENVVVSQSILE